MLRELFFVTTPRIVILRERNCRALGKQGFPPVGKAVRGGKQAAHDFKRVSHRREPASQMLNCRTNLKFAHLSDPH